VLKLGKRVRIVFVNDTMMEHPTGSSWSGIWQRRDIRSLFPFPGKRKT